MIVPNKKIPCYPNCLVNISLMLSMFRARNWTVLKPRVKAKTTKLDEAHSESLC